MAVTTPTPTEGMTGSKNQQGKPPGLVTWENPWRMKYKRKKKKKYFKGRNSPNKEGCPGKKGSR